MKILIVKMSAIGDVIQTLPALNALREKFPGAKITWLVEEDATNLLEGHRAIDRLLISKRKRWVKGFLGPACVKNMRAIIAFTKALQDTRYDIIIDFQNLLKSALWVGLAKGRRKIGFDRGMAHMEKSYLFYNERVPPVDMNIHALLRYLRLLSAIGIDTNTICFNIPIANEDRIKVDALIKQHGYTEAKSLVAINPMARWETKGWSHEKFALLADRLIDRCNISIVFTGSGNDRQDIENILARMNGTAVNLAGKTSLKELGALYEKARLVISTDTGPMHLAAALNTPVAALFGPTSGRRTGPFGDGHEILTAGVSCRPCFRRKCPIDTMDCMKQILVYDVFQKARDLLERDIFQP